MRFTMTTRALLGVALLLCTAISVSAEFNNDEFEDEDDVLAEAKKFICYWGSWAYYRAPELQFTPKSIDAYMCTHLIYSFVGLNKVTNKIGSMDPWLDYTPDEYEEMEDGTVQVGGLSLMREAVGLKSQNPDLKVLVAIGGWGQESERFSLMANDTGKRKTFISSAVAFLRNREFDGLDMDWEYPAMRDGNPEDKENFVILLKELKEAFVAEGRGWLLTAAVGAGPATVEKAYNVSEMNKHLDFINIMAYDLKVYVENEWEQIGHHSPLHPKETESDADRALSVSAAVQMFIDLKATRRKLALGVGAYGKTYTMKDPTLFNFYDPVSGPGGAFGISQEPGSIFYSEICYYIARPEGGMDGWNFGFDLDYRVPYGHNGTLWIGYDDEASIIEKVDYAEEMRLGAMMIWSIDQDDFHNYCGGWYRNPIGGTVRRRLDFHAEKK